MRHTFIGFDPGTTGACAIIDPAGQVTIHDLPTVAMPGDGYVRRKVAARPLAMLLRAAVPDGAPCRAVVELVHTYPSQGDGKRKGNAPQIQASLQHSSAIIEAVCDLCGLPLQQVTPQEWKRFFGISADKDDALAMAVRVLPAAAAYFKRKADHNRAEAALMAHWLRRQADV